MSALLSALLHLLFLLILLYAAKPVVTTPQGSSGGGRVKVDFIGQPAPEQPVAAPPSPKPSPGAKARSDAVARERVGDGRKLRFDVEVKEGERTIGVGTHERRVIET